MKLYEKIIVVLTVIAFLIQLLPNFPDKIVVLGFMTTILSFSYFFGGFWLFNSKQDRKYFLPIAAGIALFFPIVIFPFIIELELIHSSYVYSIFNGILFMGVAIYLLRNRKTGKARKETKAIFIRSSIVLFVSLFFIYTPISFKPYASMLMAINSENERLINNIKMHDYMVECKAALANKDCDKAIEYGLKANKAGRIWLGMYDEATGEIGENYELLKDFLFDSIRVNSEENKEGFVWIENKEYLFPIGSTYVHLYKAYRCRAGKEYYNGQYDKALQSYKLAYTYLTGVSESKYWKIEEAFALSNIARSYTRLNEFALADSLYVESILLHEKVADTLDVELAKLYAIYALSLSQGYDFENSNKAYLKSNSILEINETNPEVIKVLIDNYDGLVKNSIYTSEFDNALIYIEKSVEFLEEDDVARCTASTYKAVCLYGLYAYQEAQSILYECIDCFEKHTKFDKQNRAVTYLLLGQVKSKIGEYEEARSYVKLGLEIAESVYGTNHAQYAYFLSVLTDLEKTMGEYSVANEMYAKVIEIYKRTEEEELPFVLSSFSELQLKLSNFDLAKKLSNESISLATNFGVLNSVKATILIETAGYVNYSVGAYELADSLYHRVLSLHVNQNPNFSIKDAGVLNGLGLVRLAKGEYIKADSLFQQSLGLFLTVFPENHPNIANVYLNQSILLIKEGKLKEAEEKLLKTFQIYKQFLKPDHDIFGNIYLVFGDLEKSKNNNATAKEYYQKALSIYSNKFSENHAKVVLSKQRLK